MFNFEQQLKKLPEQPGVYLMHDKEDKVIYVGKAKVLKNAAPTDFCAGTPPNISTNGALLTTSLKKLPKLNLTPMKNGCGKITILSDKIFHILT